MTKGYKFYGDIKNVRRGTRQKYCESCSCMLLGNESTESRTVSRVLQNLSNLRVGQVFEKCSFRSAVKSVFIPEAPGELLEDLTP